MFPHLLYIPNLILAMLAGGVVLATFTSGFQRWWATLAGFVGGAGIGAGIAHWRGFAEGSTPLQGYGLMILIGFVFSVWILARRSRLIGVDPRHCIDLGVLGVMLGITGARIFHVFMFWHAYNPFAPGANAGERIAEMFMIWKGGLVFFGAFVVAIPFTWLYAKKFKIPAIPFVDLAIPSLISGLAFGRIGCFLNGCCYGKVCELPWRVQFPPGSPPFEAQVYENLILPTAAHSLPVHPSQIYAAVAAALTSGFLYAYWPRRRFDGEVISLALVMVGGMRFFEELLRSDDVAAFPSLSTSLTIAQWFAIAILAAGIGSWIYFRRRATLSHFPAAGAAT